MKNNKPMKIDINLARDGDENSLNDWTEEFNKSGEIMIALPDIYLAGKSNDTSLIKSLQRDFREMNRTHPPKSLITSSELIYGTNNTGRIIHYSGSNVTEPIERKVVIPKNSKLDLILEEEKGLEFIRALLNTNDDIRTIKKTLTTLSRDEAAMIQTFTSWRDKVVYVNNIHTALKKYTDSPIRLGDYRWQGFCIDAYCQAEGFTRTLVLDKTD